MYTATISTNFNNFLNFTDQIPAHKIINHSVEFNEVINKIYYHPKFDQILL